jgi:gas vesicle protein
MMIKDLLCLVSSGKRGKNRRNAAKQVAAGVAVVVTTTALGVAAGIFLAPQSGKETWAGIKKKASETVATIRNAAANKADNVKAAAVHAGEKVTEAVKEVHEKVDTAKKDK